MESWDIRSLDVAAHRPEVLHSADGAARLIAILLPGGEELQTHHTHEHTYLLVADGEVEVVQDGETTKAGPGFLAHFDEGENRRVLARSDARIMLILAPWPGAGHPSRRD